MTTYTIPASEIRPLRRWLVDTRSELTDHWADDSAVRFCSDAADLLAATDRFEPGLPVKIEMTDARRRALRSYREQRIFTVA